MCASPASEGSTTAPGSGASDRREMEPQAAGRPERTDDNRAASTSVVPTRFDPHMTDEDIALVQARRTLQFIYASRDCFPAMRELADHPGWEMLLHIFIASREGQQVNTADLCTLTGTWRPLGVRYIEMLFERGLIERDISGEKPDNWILSLSAEAEERLQQLLCSFARAVVSREGEGATR